MIIFQFWVAVRHSLTYLVGIQFGKSLLKIPQRHVNISKSTFNIKYQNIKKEFTCKLMIFLFLSTSIISTIIKMNICPCFDSLKNSSMGPFFPTYWVYSKKCLFSELKLIQGVPIMYYFLPKWKINITWI